jgi:hypothetical protein
MEVYLTSRIGHGPIESHPIDTVPGVPAALALGSGSNLDYSIIGGHLTCLRDGAAES